MCNYTCTLLDQQHGMKWEMGPKGMWSPQKAPEDSYWGLPQDTAYRIEQYVRYNGPVLVVKRNGKRNCTILPAMHYMYLVRPWKGNKNKPTSPGSSQRTLGTETD